VCLRRRCGSQQRQRSAERGAVTNELVPFAVDEQEMPSAPNPRPESSPPLTGSQPPSQEGMKCVVATGKEKK